MSSEAEKEELSLTEYICRKQEEENAGPKKRGYTRVINIKLRVLALYIVPLCSPCPYTYKWMYTLEGLFWEQGAGYMLSPPIEIGLHLRNWLSIHLILLPPPLNFGTRRLPPLE